MDYGYMSPEDYERRLGPSGVGLKPFTLILLAFSLVAALPGMAIFAAAADAFALNLEQPKGWYVSIGISVVLFLLMFWKSASFREAGRAYLSLSGIVGLLFLLVHFGLQMPFAERWVDRFLPAGAGFSLSFPGQPATAGESLAAAKPPVVVQNAPTVPVRRAVAVVDDAPPLLTVPGAGVAPAPVLPLPAAPLPSRSLSGAQPRHSIIGIPAGDTLNVRAGPGSNFAKVSELQPGYDKIVAVSSPQKNGETEWVLITFENHSGWVARQYIRSE